MSPCYIAKTIEEGIYEMGEHFGSGWRIYNTIKGSNIIVILGGGIKPPTEGFSNIFR